MASPTQVVLRTTTSLLAFVAPVAILLLQRTPAAGAFDWYRVAAWACCMVGLLSLFALAGYEMRSKVWGVLIDERNRYSLSRLQMSLWTMLVLGSLYVVFMANAVRGGASFESLNVELDPNLVLLMGFSVASFVTAPLALSRKTEQSTSVDQLATAADKLVPAQHLSTPPSAVGSLLVKGTPTDARLADLVRGEDVATSSVVDLPRTQMLLMTMVIVVAYGTAMCTRLGQGTWLLGELPALSQTLLLLVLVSHGGYLVGKLIPPANKPSGPTAEQMSRALVTSQRASELVTDLKTSLAGIRSEDARRSSLEATLRLAQALAGDAALLPARAAAADFKIDEISAMEGRLEALRTSARTLEQGRGFVSDVPAPETVAKVQRKLRALGHSVRETGTPDAETESAVSAWMVTAGASRSSLHPNRMRYYEELAQLI